MTVGTQASRTALRFLPDVAGAGWTDERVAFVRAQWIAGKSASEIAAMLDAGFSRNAVIGKVHRLGLTDMVRIPRAKPAARPAPPKATRAAKPPKPQRPAGVIASLGAVPATKGLDYKLTPATEAQIAACRRAGMDMIEWVESGCGVESPASRPFADASPSLCRWPLAGGLFCCNPKARGQYCAGHAAVGYEGEEKAPATARKRAGPYIDRVASMMTRAERVEPRQRRVFPSSPWDAGRQAA